MRSGISVSLYLIYVYYRLISSRSVPGDLSARSVPKLDCFGFRLVCLKVVQIFVLSFAAITFMQLSKSIKPVSGSLPIARRTCHEPRVADVHELGLAFRTARLFGTPFVWHFVGWPYKRWPKLA